MFIMITPEARGKFAFLFYTLLIGQVFTSEHIFFSFIASFLLLHGYLIRFIFTFLCLCLFNVYLPNRMQAP